MHVHLALTRPRRLARPTGVGSEPNLSEPSVELATGRRLEGLAGLSTIVGPHPLRGDRFPGVSVKRLGQVRLARVGRIPVGIGVPIGNYGDIRSAALIRRNR